MFTPLIGHVNGKHVVCTMVQPCGKESTLRYKILRVQGVLSNVDLEYERDGKWVGHKLIVWCRQ